MALDRRWYDAIHFKPDEFETFWSERLKDARSLLLILGMGWDPRMTATVGALKSLGGGRRIDLHLIRFSPSRVFQSPHQKFINKNSEYLRNTMDGWAHLSETLIETRNADNHYVGDERISAAYKAFDLGGYSDIIIDISALPKSLYFPLLLILVKKSMDGDEKANIHIAACQDSEFDSQIIESADDTRFLKGFRAGLSMVSRQDIPRIWVPILGRNCSVALEKLHALEDLSPTDIYPVLPFPSRKPRSDDDLLVEYRQIFVSSWRLNPMNIIYAAEDDPLDVYRRILSLRDQQQEALEPLGGVTMVISPLSSKLSSIGAFMAAFEKKMAIAHSIGRHDPPPSMGDELWNGSNMAQFEKSIHSIWVTGEPYAE